jgi:hypothetical protein
MRSLLVHCHLGLGMLERNNVDRGAQAHAELSAIIVLSRSLAMPGWLPQIEVTLAQVEA